MNGSDEAGDRKAYPSNLAKVLGLVPPQDLRRPSWAEVRVRLDQIRKLLV